MTQSDLYSTKRLSRPTKGYSYMYHWLDTLDEEHKVKTFSASNFFSYELCPLSFKKDKCRVKESRQVELTGGHPLDELGQKTSEPLHLYLHPPTQHIPLKQANTI